MKTRYAVYKQGYVKEDLTEIEPILMFDYFTTFEYADEHLSNFCKLLNQDKWDYYIQKEIQTKYGWETQEQYHN